MALAKVLADMHVVAEALGRSEEETTAIWRGLCATHPDWSDERAMLGALRMIADLRMIAGGAGEPDEVIATMRANGLIGPDTE